MPYIARIEVPNPGVVADEWVDLRGDDATQYYLKHWYPTDATTQELTQPRAAIVFVHGYTDFVDRYEGVFGVFADRGIQVSGFDQLGFGRTWYDGPDRDANHGRTTWAEQFKDVALMLKLTRARLDQRWGKDKVPLFLMGHSMGGGISAAFFTRDPAGEPAAEVKQLVSGVILMSPWLDIYFPIPTNVAIPVMRTVLRCMPNIKLPLGPAHKALSREERVVQEAKVHPLANNYVHVRCLLDPLSGGPKIVSEDYKLWPEDLPMLICHGTGDKVTRWDCSKKLYENLRAMGRHVRLFSFTGFYHEAIFEPGEDKSIYAKAIARYVCVADMVAGWRSSWIFSNVAQARLSRQLARKLGRRQKLDPILFYE